MRTSSVNVSVRDRVAGMATTDDVKKLAALARIDVPKEDLENFLTEFEAILGYIGKLEELSLEHEAPIAAVVWNVLRADTSPHEKGKWTEALVRQFPEREGNHLVVKQIITHD